MFARQRDPGLWSFDTVVEDFEFEYIDESLSNAIDGEGGGAYSLQSNLIIGGAPGIFVQFDTSATFTDAVSVQGTFEVFGGTGLYDDVTIGSGGGDLLSVQCDAAFHELVSFNDNVDFNDAATFNSAAFLQGDTYIGSGPSDSALVYATSAFVGDATFDGLVDFNGGVTFDAPAAFSGTVVTNGAGNFRVRRVRRQTLGADVDTSIDMTLTDHVVVRPGVLSAIRNYTISDTGAANGDRVRFSCFDTNGIAVKSPGGTTLIALAPGAGVPTWCDVERIDGTWRAFPGDRN